MIGIVIVAHGGLAKEYLAAVEHVVGPQPSLVAIAIGPDDDRECQAELKSPPLPTRLTAAAVVVVVTDLFGGSPSNLSLKACAPADRRILYGANLPMLIKLAKSRHLPVADAVRQAMEAGRKYINAQNVNPDGEQAH